MDPRPNPSLRALFLVTGADHWTLADGAKHPTGFWADELVEPHRRLREAGVAITLATPGGVRPVVDQASLHAEATGGPERTAMLTEYLATIGEQLASPEAIERVDPSRYDLVFVPGGHGPMEDLAVHEPTGRLLTHMLEAGRMVAVVCHAPAALLAARRADGSWPFRGFRMTGFTNAEEQQGGLAPRAPWLLEDRLRELGAEFEAGAPWSIHVVVDRNLYTGQNPMSAGPVAARIVADLGADRPRAKGTN